MSRQFIFPRRFFVYIVHLSGLRFRIERFYQRPDLKKIYIAILHNDIVKFIQQAKLY